MQLVRVVVFFAVSIAVGAYLLFDDHVSKLSFDSVDELQTSSTDEDIVSASNKQAKDNQLYIFDTSFGTLISVEGQDRGTLNFRFNMALKKEENSDGKYTGKLFDIQWPDIDSLYSKPKTLTFTTHFKNGAFFETDLLGLPERHPIAMLKPLLNQMSYYEGITDIEVEGGLYTFHYQRLDTLNLTREKIDSQMADLPIDVLDEQEDWRLSHDDLGFPVTMSMSYARRVVYSPQTFVIKQHATAKRVDINTELTWLASEFSGDVNSHLVVQADPEKNTQPPVTENNFATQLAEAAAVITLGKVQRIGTYLVERGAGFVSQLLIDDGLSDDEKSVLIFALEKSGDQEGEWILSQLIEDSNIDEVHRLRSVISIAKMGDVNTAVAVQSLKKAMQGNNLTLSRTALLNIGVLGKRAPALGKEVAGVLADRLEKQDDTYRTLLAINNLATTSMTEQVLPYLESVAPRERSLAVGILGRDRAMSALLEKALLTETHPAVVEKLLSVRSDGMSKDPIFHQSIRGRVLSDTIPDVTREILFNHLIEHSSDTTTLRDLAREMKKFDGLSQSVKDKIEQLLAG
ncbi:hypothetical protein [Veronia pacifica]|uniref:Vitellogenin domain-containing protein n=1 Tax=Veronia pacifica TaxID=1080227 RepID=A0A1C3E9H1_9GAMM|nr:hypothetical protein [Veronia pacifica]ODA29819.1 hypothetical protein A8L45_21720 [Veronia pacifica]